LIDNPGRLPPRIAERCFLLLRQFVSYHDGGESGALYWGRVVAPNTAQEIRTLQQSLDPGKAANKARFTVVNDHAKCRTRFRNRQPAISIPPLRLQERWGYLFGTDDSPRTAPS